MVDGGGCRRPLSRAAVALVPVLLVAGCSGSSPSATLVDPSPAAGASTAAGPGATRVATDEVTSVATASRVAVVDLHDVATAMSRPSDLPAGTFPGQAAHLQAVLAALAGRVPQNPTDATTNALRSTLHSYAALAGRLAAPGVNASGLTAELRATDLRWRAAVASLGARRHVDLLAGLPPLLLPRTVPPPPPRS